MTSEPDLYCREYCSLYSLMRRSSIDGLVVGCFGLNGPLRQYFSLYWTVSQREGERKEK